MKTKTKTQKQIDELTKEVRLMRSLLISIVGTDREGQYRPEEERKRM